MLWFRGGFGLLLMSAHHYGSSLRWGRLHHKDGYGLVNGRDRKYFSFLSEISLTFCASVDYRACQTGSYKPHDERDSMLTDH